MYVVNSYVAFIDIVVTDCLICCDICTNFVKDYPHAVTAITIHKKKMSLLVMLLAIGCFEMNRR